MTQEQDFNSIGPDTPLRLKAAAAIAFPDGSMTASGLRREIGRGRLAYERIANKDFTTLRNIEQMRAACRGHRKEYDCSHGGGEVARPSSLSSTDQSKSALAAAQTIAEQLRRPSPTTLPESTGPHGKVVTLPR